MPESMIAHAPFKRVSIADIGAFADRSAKLLDQARKISCPPDSRKKSPSFAISQIAESLKVSTTTMYRRMEKLGMHEPLDPKNRKKLSLTLSQVREIYSFSRPECLRPAGQKAMVITVGNFKGGSTKTSTTATLAQGLSIRGHNVLVIDTDPQGSLTTLFGIIPEAEVDRVNTILPVCAGESDSIASAAMPTYWDGAYLVASSPQVFEAEHLLAPGRREGMFWRVLDRALERARDLYDVIIIDTPPTLSYVTINAYWASDALVVPLPPNALDFASSSQFWSLFRDTCVVPAAHEGSNAETQKEFDFVTILPSRVDSTDSKTDLVMGWLKAAYGDSVCPVSIPKTTVTSGSAAEMGTIYDLDKYLGSRKTYLRAKEPYDQFIDYIEQRLVQSWTHRVEQEAATRLQELKGKKND